MPDYETELEQFMPDMPVPERSYEEEQIVMGAYCKLHSARQYRKQYDKDWPKYYLIYAGQHWDGRQADWQSTPVVNLTNGFIHTLVPILTDSRPQIAILPRKLELERTAMMISDIVEWLWDQNNCEVKLPMVMVNTMIFGNGFWKIRWNPALQDGQGDIEVVCVDAVNMFISPYARTLNEATYVIHAENMPRGMVNLMYGGSLDAIGVDKGGPEEPSLTVSRTVTSQEAPGGGLRDRGVLYVRATDGSSVEAYQRGAVSLKDGADPDELCTVLEMYEREIDGSVKLTVIVNDRVVMQRPFELSRFPFVHFVNRPHTWTLWSDSEIQHVEKLQLEINRRRGHLMDILAYTAHPMLAVDPSMVEDYDQIVPRPNLILPVEGGPSGIGWISPPPVPPALFEINALDKADFDTILGNVEAMQGRRPEGVEAGVAIELLQEAANVRMRLKVRHMENSLKQAGEIIVEMVQHYYDNERVFMIVGNALKRTEAPVTQDAIQQQQMMELSINQAVSGQIGPDGQPMVDLLNKIPKPFEAKFDVRIGAGSTLPVSRMTQFQKCITLFQLGVIDDTELLRNSGLPHWDEVHERVLMKRQAMMQEQQAMAAQAPPDGSQPPAPVEPTDAQVDEEIDMGGPVGPSEASF
jgi:hypothetical protein